MNLNPEINNLQLQLSPNQKSLVEIVKSEELDEFVELKSVKGDIAEYSTVHGWRILSNDRPGKNIFFVVEDRADFARGNPIPYELHYSWELLTQEEITSASFLEESTDVCMLVVNFVSPDEPAAEAGWAKAVDLPYYLQHDFFFNMSLLIVDLEVRHEAKTAGYAKAVPLPYSRYLPEMEFNQPRKLCDCCQQYSLSNRSSISTVMYSAYSKATQLPDEAYLKFHSACYFTICLPNSIEVCINSQNKEATSVGYANAVPIPVSKSDIHIEDLQMLDTEYADSLVN